MATVTKQQIADFVAANLDNPQAIADAAAQYGVSSSDIASAMNVDVGAVTNYFNNASVAPPPVDTTPAPTPTPTPTPTPATTPDTYVNQYTGHVMQAIPGQLDEAGNQAYLDVTGTAINAAGGGNNWSTNLLQDAVAIGLAYALPIAGEAIAASLTEAGIATSVSVGTALAAVGTGVAQGQTLEQAITNAAPSLIASGVMSQVDLGNLSDSIKTNPTLANVVNNVAGSVIATAAKGGTAQDLLTNAVAAGGGTLIGDSLQGQGVSPSTAQAVGRTIATTAATGNVVSGLSSGAGSLGGTQASQNAVTRNFDNMIPTTTADGKQTFFDPKTSITYNADGSVYAQAPALGGKGVVDYSVYKEPTPTGPTMLATSGYDAQNLIATGQWTLSADGTYATDRDGNIHYKKPDGSFSDPSYASSPPAVANSPALQKGIDATNAAIQANGVPSGAVINNPQVKSYTDPSLPGSTGFSVETNVVATSPDGKQTGYVIVYEPISGKTLYTYNYTDPTTNNVQVIASKTPPDFDTTTQSFTGATPTTETITPEVINTALGVETTTPSTGQAPITSPETTSITSNTVIPSLTSPTATQTGTGGPGAATPTNALSSTTGTPGIAGPSGPGVPGAGKGTSEGGGGGGGGAGGAQNTISNLSGFDKGTAPGGGGPGTGGGGTGTGGTPTPTPSPTPTPTPTTTPEVLAPISTPEITPSDEVPTDITPITITTSSTKPPTIKAALPTIQGQFASPLTPSASAYIPAGEIPGTETGKPKEDVWNQESLREGLGI